MKNNVGAAIAIAILAIGGYFVYKTKFWIKPNQFTRETAIEKIVTSGAHSNPDTLSTFEEAFLKAWAAAVAQNNPSFIYNSATYNTTGGKKIK